MKGKTVDELRALARSRGLGGYSRLTKDGLIRLLSVKKPATSGKSSIKKKKTGSTTASAISSKKTRGHAAGKKRATPLPETTTPPARQQTPLPRMTDDLAAGGTKYAIDMPGTKHTQPALSPDLHEPIDHLPELPATMLVVLQQKPGVVHVSWRTTPDTATPDTARLRLLHGAPGAQVLLHDIPLPATRGSRYFRLDMSGAPDAIAVQIGHYRRDGSFVTTLQQTTARPLHAQASTHTHPKWWLSPQDFALLYLHGGGQGHISSTSGSDW